MIHGVLIRPHGGRKLAEESFVCSYNGRIDAYVTADPLYAVLVGVVVGVKEV
jgi:hypothetical protein